MGDHLFVFNSTAMQMACEALRTIFLDVMDSNHGGFLKAFAGAVVAADDENLIILLPAATEIIAKYNLLEDHELARVRNKPGNRKSCWPTRWPPIPPTKVGEA